MNATTRSQPYRIASTVISIAALAVLIAGVPYLLWQLGGWPFPTSVPTVDAIRDALSRPIPDTVIVDVLAIAAWVGWLLFCWSLLTEALAQIRGVALRRARLTSPFHGIARHLIGSITVLAAGLPAVSLTATPAMAEPATTIVTESQITSHDHPPLRLVEPASRPPDTRDPGPGPNAVAGADYPVVTVERHDSYWAIAERTLGDPMRWREIRNLNVGRTLDDGSVITDATLYSGWKLLLPHDATVDVDTAVPRAMPGLSGSAPDAESTVVVERDDNLWTISEARLEDDLGRDA
ncbi:MAG TPA: LysM peptidoglycan-binding domain-containing protein, partial [Microthrixaceae bacterium]|nr:LysM peptidoglycan-binding domain-containing protein [Microthrixaceae bacterium]